jgi:DNA-directed RNA polymerase beta' subunit
MESNVCNIVKNDGKTKMFTITENLLGDASKPAELKNVNFKLFTDDEISRLSVVEVKETKQMMDYPNGVYDFKLGVIRNGNICKTCDEGPEKCSGHFGHIELPTPIPHPLYIKEVLFYLNMFCFNSIKKDVICNRLYINENEILLKKFNEFSAKTRINKIYSFIQNIGMCMYCGGSKHRFTNDKKVFYHNFINEKNENVKKEISYTQILNFLNNIHERDIELLSFKSLDKDFHPRNYILQKIIVLPICARPFVESNRGICDDDITNRYIEIIKKNNTIKNLSANEKETDKNKKIQKEIYDLFEKIETMFDNHHQKSKQIGGRPIKSFRERLVGKEGLLRNNLMGKRGDFTARTVIDGDPTTRADEIYIPPEFADKLTIEVIAFKHNLNELQNIVNENKASHVETVINGEIRNINLSILSTPKITGEIGNFNLNDLIDGDIICRKKDGKLVKFTYNTNFCNKWLTTFKTPFELQNEDKIYRKEKLIHTFERVNITLHPNDIIIRNNKKILLYNKNFKLQTKDVIIRNGLIINNIICNESKKYIVKLGDKVHRNLQDGDQVLFNRQPSLHKGSVIARYIRIQKNENFINMGRNPRVFRMNLAQCKTYNADFDGDEMNIYVAQSVTARAELKECSSTKALIKTCQNSKLLLEITQDALASGYYFTRKNYIPIKKHVFNDVICQIEEWFEDINFIINPSQKIKELNENFYQFIGNEKLKKTFTGIFNYNKVFNEENLVNSLVLLTVATILYNKEKNITSNLDSKILNYFFNGVEFKNEDKFVNNTFLNTISNKVKKFIPNFINYFNDFNNTINKIISNVFAKQSKQKTFKYLSNDCNFLNNRMDDFSDNYELNITKMFEKVNSCYSKSNYNHLKRRRSPNHKLLWKNSTTIWDKLNHIKTVLKWKNINDTDTFIYSGHGLFSLLLPDDFNFSNSSGINIVNGVMISGTLNKSALGSSFSSIPHKIEKEYGADAVIDFISWFQWIFCDLFFHYAFSVSIEDCQPIDKEKIDSVISKAFMEAQSAYFSEADPIMRERKVNIALNSAVNIGGVITKETMGKNNNLTVMIAAGSKGSNTNNANIRSLVGQQNLCGNRLLNQYNTRTLPCYPFNMENFLPEENNFSLQQQNLIRKDIYESRGFISNCYMSGLNQREFFLQCVGSRESVVDSSLKTASSGYIQRKLVKRMEDYKMNYQGIVTNNKNIVIQFDFGNGFDPARLVKVKDNMTFINVSNLADKYNNLEELENYKKTQEPKVNQIEEIKVKKVKKNKEENETQEPKVNQTEEPKVKKVKKNKEENETEEPKVKKVKKTEQETEEPKVKKNKEENETEELKVKKVKKTEQETEETKVKKIKKTEQETKDPKVKKIKKNKETEELKVKKVKKNKEENETQEPKVKKIKKNK